MFTDVVGSTALTEHMDPEDARDLLGGVIGRVVEAVEAYGGTVKDLAGDGVLAFFGAPTAHEDDEERAVLAALRVLADVEDYRSGLADPDAVVAVRIGIDTGEAVPALDGRYVFADLTADWSGNVAVPRGSLLIADPVAADGAP